MGRRKSYQVPIGYKDPGGKKVKNRKERDFPGGPVVKTPCFQCRGCRFSPCSGN